MISDKGLVKPGLIAAVRSAIAKNDLSDAERQIRTYRGDHGITPETLEALSWLARAAFSAHRFEKATGYARKVHRMAVRICKVPTWIRSRR
jgi:hypothetical protein